MGNSVARGRSHLSAAVRRRRVLAVMLGVLAVPAVIGLATGSAAAWWAVVAFLPVVCTYLAVLFRARRLMAEREINLAFFGSVNRAGHGLEDAFGFHYEEPLEKVASGR
jgi:Flp pilus assembly protein TadB